MPIFNTVPVKRPQMSAFDLSYNNYFTCDMGELIPAFVLPVMPSDRIQYAPTFQVRFAPMLNPVFADIYAKVECFFVPYRLLWDSWKTYITGVNQVGHSEVATHIPNVNTSTFTVGSSSLKPNELDGVRLADFFGAKGLYRMLRGQIIVEDYKHFEFNCFPFRAYTLIWNEYYRDEFIDKPFSFGKYGSTFGDLNISSGNISISTYGVFRRRWQKDYFTTATPSPQLGADASGVQVTISGTEVSDLKGFFSVAQFRVANALQRFLERTNIGGGRYNEFILAHFGCMPTDATIQRPEFLGSVTAPVQVSAVTQTSAAPSSVSVKSNTLGSQAGQASAVGTNLCFRRSFQEYGIILGLFSVFPRPVYSDGVSRYLSCGVKGSRFDFGFPEFAGIGDQQIDKSELSTFQYSSYGIGFGYQQRYAEFKFMNDEVHGDFSLIDSGLAQYTFARFFSAAETGHWIPELNSSFLECTPRADCFVLKNTSSADSSIVNQCWVQLRNNVKVIRALPKFSTPTL